MKKVSFQKIPVIFLIILLVVNFNVGLVLAGPASDNYELKDYSFGAGGGKSESDNYATFGLTGEVDTGKSSSDNYDIGAGLNFTLQANVPPAPAFTNPDENYNKLQLILDTGDNPSDAEFAIAISTDAFATDTKYVQSDDTVGPTLGSEDWQTYAVWGGGTGFFVIGLTPDVTYTVKVAARDGDFTQTAFGPTASAATIDPYLTFDIDVSATDSETSPPYTLPLGTLSSSSVTTGSDKIWVDFATNAEMGGEVWIYDVNSGLKSTATNYTITSTSTNLAVASEGFGVRSNSATQVSGGPLVASAPYDGSNDNVGLVDTTIRSIYTSADKIIGGRSSVLVKSKASNVTPAATDYADLFTLIAAGVF